MNISEYTTIGTRLALSTPEDKIVITGAAGRFPESDNIEKLCENFKNRVYMVTNDERRWKQFQEDVPNHTGKINHIDKLDAGFFDMNYQEAENMDPQCRQILERAFEAILDSGYNPSELENTRTAVLVAATLCDSEKMLLYDNLNSPNYGFTGCSHSMLAHQISYRLGLNGRSLNVDSACSSSLYQLDEAYTAIRMGSCDNALIVGTHLVLNPYLNCSFYKLGMVSLHGDSLVFDGNGYNRSEAAAAIFVQRAKDARRIYAEIVHIKSCNDGFKEEGITFPSPQDQIKMMEEVCGESKVNPNTVTYFEAHAAGTKVGDPQEVESLYQVFCSKRKVPLLIGSAKSLVGHTEPVSGLCALLKVVLGMNNDFIYPNYHNDKNEPLELLKNRNLLKLVTEATKWHENGNNLAAINCYGFGGTNSIAIVKPFSKGKVNSGLPKDDLVRLVCVSGRTKESVALMFDDLASKPLDEEYIRLLHAIFSHSIRNHPMRGFIMLSKMGEIERSVERRKETKLCLLFNNFNCNSKNVIKILLELPLLQEKFAKIHEVVGVGKGQNPILTTVAVHCSLFDSLREIGLQFDFVFGVSAGILSAAYANGRLTLKEVILLASCINEACNTLDMCDIFVGDSGVHHEDEKVDKLKEWILNVLGRISDDNGTVETFATLIGKLFNSNCFEENALDVRDGEMVCVNIGLGCTETKSFECVDLISKVTERGIITHLLSSLGRIHQLGYNLKLDKLYSNVQWPVSRGTPNVSPVIGWDHTDNWHFYRHHMQISNCVQTFDFSLKGHDPNWSFLSGHVLDGQRITPISALIYMVWDTISRMYEIMKSRMKVSFENVRMYKFVNILDQNKRMVVRILKQSNRFEVEEMGETILTGRFYLDEITERREFSVVGTEHCILSGSDVYKKLVLQHYQFNDLFCGIEEYDAFNKTGLVKWEDNWITFLENLLQLYLLENANELCLPNGIEKLSIDAADHLLSIKNLEKKDVFRAYAYNQSKIIRCGGVEIYNITTKTLTVNNSSDINTLTLYKFISFCSTLSTELAINAILQIILENGKISKISEFNNQDRHLTSLVTKILSRISTLPPATLSQNSKLNSDLLIISNALKLPNFDEIIINSDFILSRESKCLDLNKMDSKVLNKIRVVAQYLTERDQLVLFKAVSKYTTPTKIVTISNDYKNFDWIYELQNALKTERKLLLLAETDQLNGILGFFNTLKVELGHSKIIQCVFIMDEDRKFDINDKFFYCQLEKNLSVNVLKDNKWGSYLCMPLESRSTYDSLEETKRRYLETHVGGFVTDRIESLIDVYHASITTLFDDEEDRQSVFDFSGKDSGGNRVMGLRNGKVTNGICDDPMLTWTVPEYWSLEDAVLVPSAYVVAAYILLLRGDLKMWDSVLFHCVPSSALQAMIEITKYHHSKVFISDENEQTLVFLKNQYSSEFGVHVGNLNTNSFQNLILRETNQKGLQIVVNGSSHLMLNCFGVKVLQINNNSKSVSTIIKRSSLCFVSLNCILHQEILKTQLYLLIKNGLNNGMIKPLNGVNVEAIKENETLVPRFYGNPKYVYIIIGGLGGIGLEFIDWLVCRGVRMVIVSSRRGIVNGYQKLKVSTWRSKDVTVVISVGDIATKDCCFSLLKLASKYGPVDGIFNLAVLINDRLFNNQDAKNFATPFPSKVSASKHLDSLSRNLCPKIRYFVTFSSFGCSSGNIGQTSYNMANSTMERICERRKRDGYPALAIQWGPFINLGLVTSMKGYNSVKTFGYTKQQSFQAYFKKLDAIITQNDVVVICKAVVSAHTSNKNECEENIAEIIGITNLKAVSRYVTFPELGMDSTVITEIQSYLNTYYNLCLGVTEIKRLTFAKLKEMVASLNVD